MKKLITPFLIILTMVTIEVTAQCKYKINEKDSFTGQLVKETKDFKLASTFTSSFTIRLRKVDNNYSIYMNYGTTGNKVFVIPEDEKLMFKLDDNTIISISALKTTSSKQSRLSGIDVTEIGNYYSITKEELENLRKHKILIIRFYTTDGYLEKEPTENGQNKFWENIGCILKE